MIQRQEDFSDSDHDRKRPILRLELQEDSGTHSARLPALRPPIVAPSRGTLMIVTDPGFRLSA
ncbi:hypothetical protein AA0472_2810 [Acetobacter estunensis NRIC 0472]|nr:hypothetical protein AA0472_2810 [Acetobacter estunensis NRIC 0472]